MKKEIEIKLFGLNELGVNVLNEYHKHHIEAKIIPSFQIGDLGLLKQRRIKYKKYQTAGQDANVLWCFIYEVHFSGYNGEYLTLQLKHFKHEIYEVEITENLKRIG